MTHVASPRPVPPGLLVGLGAVVFLANAGLLVLQLLAGRFLAPFIGSSVETWTCVIGVFLTGIALGNHYGGRLADRNPSTRALGRLLVLGGLSALSMILWWVVFRGTSLDQVLPLTPRIPLLTALFCLPPAFVLSLMTPLTIKLMLPDVTRAGRVAGLVFALSTLGCLVGNYATGFWLMADYTLNAIAVGVAVGLLVLAVPMFLAGYRLLPAGDAPAGPPKVTAEDDPLGFGKDIRRAFVVVFLASFCGMSLELTASRVLAPVLGVSLYSWTGIIGVMLAGTACGNYLGGVIADRGSAVGVRRLALLMGVLVGFASGPAFVRSLRLDNWPTDLAAVWTCRVIGAVAGLGLVALTAYLSGRGRRGQIVWLAAVGGAIGYAVAHPVVRSLGKLVGVYDLPDRFAGVNHALGFDVGSLVVHLLAAATGALISVGLGYDSEAKQKPAGRTTALAISLFAAALCSGMVVLLNGLFQNDQLGLRDKLEGYDIVWNVLAWTFTLFFVPMLCLGTISPQVIRLTIPDTGHAGRVAGTVYAWSTAGAIVGTFATGYFLIDLLGMARVLFLLSLVLLGLTFALGRLWKNTPLLFAGSIVFGIGVVGMFMFGYGNRGYTLESKYYAIQVKPEYEQEGGEKVLRYKLLILDHLIHSYVRPDDPNFLGYPHEEVQAELVRAALSKGPTHVLVIGGGGYTLPRWVEHNLPQVGVDVVEIDPGVTEVAHRELGLSRNTTIRSFHMDGRQFVREKAKKGHYQLVVQDAVNDLSVPYHLMTKEYNDAVKATLAPGGAYLLTLIDSIEDGELWRAAVHTMRQSFKYVVLLDPSGFPRPKDRHVFIVYGSDEPFDLADVQAVAREAYLRQGQERPASIHMLEPDRLEFFLNQRPKLVLTDQYAPVDNLMSGVFRERTRSNQ